jgi:AraC family transcriptional regulator
MRQQHQTNPVAKAVWFIEIRLAEEGLSLDRVAEAAGVSRFHLSRAFGLATGCSVMRYVRGRRLTEAARALAGGASDILTVALDAGYGSHEAFTRAFRDQFGQTPETVRACGCIKNLPLTEPITMSSDQTRTVAEPRIEQGRAMLIAGLQDHFAFEELGGLPALWQRVRPMLGHIDGQAGAVAYGVCFNTNETGFDYIAGVEVAAGTRVAADLASLSVAPQRYAVFTHTGHVSGVRGTFMAIFNDWLPRSGHRTEDAPVFERYDERFDGRTGMGGFEIWVPIKS